MNREEYIKLCDYLDENIEEIIEKENSKRKTDM